MSAIITPEVIRQKTAGVREGDLKPKQDLSGGRVDVDKKIFEEIIHKPVVSITENHATRIYYIHAIGLVPTNIEEVVREHSRGLLFSTLKLELVEWSYAVRTETLWRKGKEEADLYMKVKVDGLTQAMKELYEKYWKSYNFTNKMRRNYVTFRSEFAQKALEEFNIKNL
jgi:hypothetical protein